MLIFLGGLKIIGSSVQWDHACWSRSTPELTLLSSGLGDWECKLAGCGIDPDTVKDGAGERVEELERRDHGRECVGSGAELFREDLQCQP